MKPSRMRDQLQERIPWLCPYVSQPQCRYCMFGMHYDVKADGRVVIEGLHDNTCPILPDTHSAIDVTDITGLMGPTSHNDESD